MNRKVIWGIPIGMVAVGLLILVFTYAQPSCPATVLSIGKRTYTPSRKMARGTSSAVYREQLEVLYEDGQTATVIFSSTNPHILPKVGDEVRICRWITGMVTHPNRTLIGIGGASAGIGAFFLFTFLLTKWSMSRQKTK